MGITTGLKLEGLKSLACMYLCVVCLFINFRGGMINIVHYSSAICVKRGRRIRTFGVLVISEQSNIVIRENRKPQEKFL